MNNARHTPGPWCTVRAEQRDLGPWENYTAITLPGFGGLTPIALLPTHERAHTAQERDHNACLVAAAPLLLMIAEIAGTAVWQSMSEAFHQPLTQGRKADILAAYRAWCGLRDGKLSSDEAWQEVSAIHARYQMGAAP